MSLAVKTRELSKHFGDFVAVDRLNLEIETGEVCAFLGPNGAGKTTTIRMLCGILAIDSGSAAVLGLDLKRDSDRIKNRIGYMSQKFSLYEELSVAENLDFYAGLYNLRGKDKKHRCQEMITLSGLEGREACLVNQLSRGYRQRLALACAIISRPALIFLDEPTSGVSPSSRRAFFDLIRELSLEGTTVIVSTHFMDEAERCDRIAFFNQGKLLALDSPTHLKQSVLEGILLEAEFENPLSMIPAIQTLPGVKECSVHGRFLHILADAEYDPNALESNIKTKTRIITPGLEDVFVALARKRESR
ncbi:ABC transporter ATP-binding protein [Syntrophomonas palmitatica]|uniref:ABC transporter ATP-binding protein n=1 Tax=Syntrophomonas palmitatica TaxID=402877 RepID=UPI0006D03206|nr:ABC transporter ATP-binding protein [Syntrophomonas palmitatica]